MNCSQCLVARVSTPSVVLHTRKKRLYIEISLQAVKGNQKIREGLSFQISVINTYEKLNIEPLSVIFPVFRDMHVMLNFSANLNQL